uniref:Uncharacterized protein n=1 Tax=Tetraselmis sp. GSL018 TaxID=582737 RepID=A0A061QMX0_9CHLO
MYPLSTDVVLYLDIDKEKDAKGGPVRQNLEIVDSYLSG